MPRGAHRVGHRPGRPSWRPLAAANVDMMSEQALALRRRCATFTLLMTAFAVLVSAVGLLVWPRHVWLLDGGLPVTSVPGRAAEWSILLAAVALWLRRAAPAATAAGARGPVHYLAQSMAVGVFLIGLIALLDPGVTAVAGFAREMPMGTNSALVVCLLGLSLMTLDVTTRRGHRPAEFAVILVALVAVVALFGYAYRVSELYTLRNSYPMVPRTAILGFLLAMAVLCARPGIGFMALSTSGSFGGALVRRLLPATLVMLFAMGWLRLEGERRGWYGAELGVALFTLTTIVIFTLLVWWSARTMRRLEQERDASEALRNKALALNLLIMENSLDVLCVIDDAGRFLQVSLAATTQWGYPPAELIGRPYADLVHPEDQAQTAEVTADIVSGHPAIGFTNRLMRKDGSVVPVDWSAVWSASSHLMFGVARDASRRLQVAETLSRNAEALAQTNRELESFTYSVSHDLRAPLRHIDGYARMLEEDGGDRLDGDLRRYLDEIGASARRMGRLIDDLLAFSRLGRQSLMRFTVDMRDLVDSALSEIDSDQPRSATVVIGALPAVQVDPGLFKQVWINLLGNAIKYSRKRGPEALVEVCGENDGTTVRYRVRDNGVGFDMRYVDKLFQVFQRLHLQDEFEGTGVGLAIVQRVISRHGGRVWAEGHLGEGATFTFELPVVGDLVEGEPA